MTLFLLSVLVLTGCGTPSPVRGVDSGREPVVVSLSDSLAFSVPVDPPRIVAIPLGDQCAPPPLSDASSLFPAPAQAAVPDFSPDSAALSNGPLQALGAYIAHSRNCDTDLVEWNGRRLVEAETGKLSRHDYYRMLSFLRWGKCGNPAFAGVLQELVAAARQQGDGAISPREFEAKEAHLIDRFFAAVKEGLEAPALSPMNMPPSEVAGVESSSPLSPSPPQATGLSGAPLQALAAYIELSGSCSQNLVEWNRHYGAKARTGEMSRAFYYRVLGYLGWGDCGREFFPPVFQELQKSAEIFAQGSVSDAEFEAKEGELVGLLFSALGKETRGMEMVRDYERNTAGRLIDLQEPRQYFNCTFFGNSPRCRE